MGVLVICMLVFTVFLCCFVYVYLFLFVLSLLIYRLVLPSEISIAVNNNNNNKYTPATVLENENFKLYCNRSILTDKTVPLNRSDITFMNKKTKNTFLIYIAVTNTHNLAKTITDKQNKYQDMANEICAM